MNAILSWLWATAKTHGVGFALLVIAVLHFHRRTEGLEADIKLCQEQRIESITTQNGALVRALNDNTQALTRLEKSITDRR